jgi:hypothetical protein
VIVAAPNTIAQTDTRPISPPVVMCRSPRQYNSALEHRAVQSPRSGLAWRTLS